MRMIYEEDGKIKDICGKQANIFAKYLCPLIAFFKGIFERQLTLNTWEETRYGLRGALYCQTVIFIDGNVNISIHEDLFKKDPDLVRNIWQSIIRR